MESFIISQDSSLLFSEKARIRDCTITVILRKRIGVLDEGGLVFQEEREKVPLLGYSTPVDREDESKCRDFIITSPPSKWFPSYWLSDMSEFKSFPSLLGLCRAGKWSVDPHEYRSLVSEVKRLQLRIGWFAGISRAGIFKSWADFLRSIPPYEENSSRSKW